MLPLIPLNRQDLQDAGRLVQKEARAKGNVKLSVYGDYVSALGGVPAAIGILGLFVLYQVRPCHHHYWIP